MISAATLTFLPQTHFPHFCRYTTRVEAPKADYPVLLSNGNLQSTGELPGDRHFAVWVDPFPKPCYLFALVAGNLKVKERVFKTCSGRDVTLRIFVQVRVWRRSVEECAVAAGWGRLVRGGRKGNWMQTCSGRDVTLRIFACRWVWVGRGRGVELHPRCFCTNPNSSFSVF